ncbi:hypothetical protein BJ165DRAFT_165235 [Panaeolus papilionaceus]|nr:hypothetical protein BJ165DRAFT_165235 [Panaeolus papilionaceus]
MTKSLEVFGSATDKTAQKLSVDVVYQLMNHDYFRWKLFTPMFFDSVCEAMMSQHETYRQSALQILCRLLDDDESFVLFSKKSNVVCLIDLLKTSEPQSQWLIMRILAKLARFENTRACLISYQIYDKIWDLIAMKNHDATQTETAVLETLQLFFSYTDLRAALDCASFVLLVVHLMLMDLKDVSLGEASFNTFQVLMAHEDVHERMLSSSVVRAIGGALYSAWPHEFNSELSGTQQYYLREMLRAIEDIDEDAYHSIAMCEEDNTLVSPGIEIPPSPLELHRCASAESDDLGLHELVSEEHELYGYYCEDEGEGEVGERSFEEDENNTSGNGEHGWRDEDSDSIILPDEMMRSVSTGFAGVWDV